MSDYKNYITRKTKMVKTIIFYKIEMFERYPSLQL